MTIRYARHLGFVVGMAVLGVGAQGKLLAQTGTAPAQTAPATDAVPATTPVPATNGAKKRKTSSNSGPLQRIPIEQVPPSPPRPDETPTQRAADQKLLQQQQAQSAQAAQVTDQQVRTAQQRIDKVQNEQRIQDAPGPSQTGIVPAAGPPLIPAGGGSATIQDAPGPAQTIAPATQPANPVPAQPAPPPQR